jgi:UDP-N-acetylmuramoyl-L-alanyl-D-glutamate--2,6-diaminopimelate ligase
MAPSYKPAAAPRGAIRGVGRAGGAGARVIGDRREAIRSAAALLKEGDILVVAGKGHEQGQIVGDVTHPFDDVAETAQALELVHG